ncbi:MAG TPA: hotdog domain-containing protein [Bacteroidales bacterium]|nr:hotdog domain-containing protein [Bacteroidales bacterium]
MNKRIQNAETKQTRVIFPSTLNTQDSLFGGNIMKWMDEVAYITAVRYEREKMVTVSVDKIKFQKSVCCGSIIEIVGKIVKVKTVKLEVLVEVSVEGIYSDEKEVVAQALFVFAPINEDHKPKALKSKN